LENRMRFGFEVFEELRKAVGDDYILGARIAGDELLSNGLSESECLKIITGYCNSGLLDYINVYQSNGDSFRGLVGMMPDMAYDSGAFLYLASGVKAEVDIPVFHGSAIRDVATAARAVAEGHVDMIAMTRAHIADPHIVNKMREGRDDDIRQCVGANYCVDRANGALCIQNASTGREKTMPHDVGRSTAQKKVVVVGGGPAGLEAARVAAARGHKVVLFEREGLLGGQLRLARALSWRENLSGITRWLEMQNRKLGVDIRLSTAATESMILAETPDVVVIATGGTVAPPEFEGSEYMVSSWDILSGKVKPGENVIVYDITGQHQGATVADFMAERGSLVEIVTPDQMIGEEIGGLARVNFMKRLYKNKVIMTISQKITRVYLEGNSMIAVLQEEYSDLQEEREVTQIVYEQGSFPTADLYFALRPQSTNVGELDQTAFIDIAPQTLVNNPEGKFQLFRIGDAVHSRNVHASIYDGSRLMRAF
jgi:NADPH-dependent 2,4-dienoyl-CoA reductase/sulfur reductase-like enzyme